MYLRSSLKCPFLTIPRPRHIQLSYIDWIGRINGISETEGENRWKQKPHLPKQMNKRKTTHYHFFSSPRLLFNSRVTDMSFIGRKFNLDKCIVQVFDMPRCLWLLSHSSLEHFWYHIKRPPRLSFLSCFR